MTRSEIHALVEIGTRDAADKIADALLPAYEKRNRTEEIAGWWRENWGYVVGLPVAAAAIWFMVTSLMASSREDDRLYLDCVQNRNAESCVESMQRSSMESSRKTTTGVILADILKDNRPN